MFVCVSCGNSIEKRQQETGELKSQVLRLRGDLSRLEKAFESRDMEDGHRVVDCKTKMKPELLDAIGI